MAYTHILAPTDFSKVGNDALPFAFEEARLHGAKLTLLHVLHHQPDTKVYFLGGDPESRAGLQDSLFGFPAGYDVYTGTSLPTAPSPPLTEVRQDYGEETLERLRELVPDTFTGDWDVAVASGDPARAILHVAQEHAVDLIVLGSHGHTGLPGLLLGSVAEKVLRRATCAVLAIRAKAQ
jgi:nucleotide-binding universal stress UspA family protein